MSLSRIGIDEVGRGPLAGPVAVCALMAGTHFNSRQFRGVRDSKKLSELQRNHWYKIICAEQKRGALTFSTAFVSHRFIDTHGMAQALRTAVQRALTHLKADPDSSKILLDGSLYAPTEFRNQETIIKGDETVLLISLASIVAKVRRDRCMKLFAKKIPQYGFEIHKGYGTALHRARLMEFGPSPIHRLSFLSRFDFQELLRK